MTLKKDRPGIAAPAAPDCLLGVAEYMRYLPTVPRWGVSLSPGSPPF